MAKLVGARVYNDANISIPDTTTTDLTFNTERWDTDSIHSVASNTGRLTCVTAGKYIIIGQIQWAGDATGLRHAFIRLNAGATVIANTSVIAMATDHRMDITTIYDLAVDDYVILAVYQNSGGALNVEASGNRSPEFMMQRIG